MCVYTEYALPNDEDSMNGSMLLDDDDRVDATLLFSCYLNFPFFIMQFIIVCAMCMNALHIHLEIECKRYTYCGLLALQTNHDELIIQPVRAGTYDCVLCVCVCMLSMMPRNNNKLKSTFCARA